MVRPDPPPPTSEDPPDPVVYDPDPDFSKHIALTGADVAHEAGITGEGVRIGVLDSGVNRNHPALSPRVVANLNYVDPASNDLSVDDVAGHGTAVAQIIAGEAFGAWPGGIAPGAEIVSARIINDEPPEDDGSGQGNEVTGALGLAPIHQDLIDRDVRIMNNSWGGLYWDDPTATDPIAEEYRPFVLDHGGLVVFAAGNNDPTADRSNPTDMAALPSQPGPGGGFPAAGLEVGWITVAALDTDNPDQLADYSNACGIAMDYCMVAPGDVVVTGTDDAYNDPSYWSWGGTSFAAPQVSGAAALVWEAYPYFDNDLVRQTLLGTATDLGDAGVDAVFGHGLLNVEAAVKGPGRLAWGDVVADFEWVDGNEDASISVWANDISGDGGIIKRGTGELVLSGNNSFTGGTSVEGGGLQVLEATLPGDASVDASAYLGLAAASVAGNLDVGGVLLTYGGDSSGFEHVIGGDLDFGSTAEWQLEVGSRLQVDGRAMLDGDVTVIGVADGYVYSMLEEILQANGGVTGTFDGVAGGEGVFLDASLQYDADSVEMSITRLDVGAAAQSMGLTPAAMGSARRIESAFDLIDGGAAPPPGFLGAAGALQRTPTSAAAERTLSSLSGELHETGTVLSLMAIDGNRHALESRLDRMPAGAGITRVWADRLDGERPTAYTDFSTGGWVMGLDQRVGNAVVGAAFSESRGWGQHALRGDRERSRQVEGQLYGAWNFGDSYLLGRLAYGRNERDLQRRILLGGQGFQVDSDYAQRYQTASLQLGHRLQVAGGTLTPYLGVQAVRLQREGFSEAGAAGFGLTTADSSATSTQGLVGVRMEQGFHLGGQRWWWNGRLEWQQQLENQGALQARFTGLDVWSPVGGVTPYHDAAVLGLGVGTGVGRNGWLSFGLDGRHQDGREYGSVFARLVFGF